MTRAVSRLTPAPMVLLAAALLSLVAAGTGRIVAVPLAAFATVCGVLLVGRFRGLEAPVELPTLATLGEWALALAPGALVLYFSFNGGGYFAGSQAFVAMLLALALGLRLAIASEPLAGYGPLSLAAAGTLALFGLWTLLSSSWSDAPGRALVEFDRVLLYLLTLLLFASVPWRDTRLRWMLRGLAGAIVLVCLIALTTRVLPDVWPIAPDVQRGRLSYPLTYWNALGLLAALGTIFLVHVTTSEREPAAARVLAAAATPAVAVTLYFTFSRGAIAVALLALPVYLVIARPRAAISGLLPAGVASALAVVSAYHADLLASDNPTSAAATAQGQHVALVVALCVLGAGLVRGLLLPLDRSLEDLRLPSHLRRPAAAAGWTALVVAVLAVFLALGGPHRVSREYDRFVHGNDVPLSGDLRTRLTTPGNNKRIEQWNVAMRSFHADEFRGAGAGTYQNAWYQRRHELFYIRDAHSLYAEVLGELGLPGMLLLGATLFALLAAIVLRTRRRRRYVGAALVAAAVAWLLRAGLDWDWEMPAVTLWLFAAGGFAAARRESRRARLSPTVRVALSVACVVVAALPAAIAVSENRLRAATAAFSRGDCDQATSSARSSVKILGFRAEPHEVLALCEARAGGFARALAEIRIAVRRDPGNWRYRYDMALILASAGRDGGPSALLASRLNPLEPRADDLAYRLADPAQPDERLLKRDLFALR